MLASIHPLGERARNSHYWTTALAYVFGAGAGGTLFGSIMGLLGGLALPALSPGLVALAAAMTAAAGVVLDLGIGRVPTWHRQVNEDWLTTYRGWVYGIGFGFQLGMGVVTIVTTASIYAVFVLAFASQSWTIGALLGAVFGIVRSALVFTVAGVDTPEALRAMHRRMQRRAAAAQRSVVGAQFVVLITAIGVFAWL